MTIHMNEPSVHGSKESSKTWTVGTLTYTTGGLAILFFWLLWGDFAWSLKERAVPPVVQLLLKQYGASDTMAGFLIGSLPYLIGMVIGPVISYASDRHRGRWGRRIPFLVGPIPFAIGAMVGLAYSPTVGNWVHHWLGSWSPSLNFSIALTFGLFWTLFEFSSFAANSVFGALVNDVVPSAFLGRFFGLFRALSLVAGIVFNYTLMGHAEKYYHAIFLGGALIYTVGFLMMCWKVKEGTYPPPPDVEPGKKHGLTHNVKVYFRECYTDPYYLWYFVMMAFSWISSVPINLFSIFYAKSLNMDIGSFGKYLALTYVISLALSYFMGVLADRFHPLRVGWVALFLYALCMLWGGLYAITIQTFAVIFVLHGVLSGAWMTTTASIGQRLLPKGKYAQYASAEGMVTSVFRMVIGLASGIILDFFHHEYRYTFYMGLGLTVLALTANTVVYFKFKALGGLDQYSAPEKTR